MNFLKIQLKYASYVDYSYMQVMLSCCAPNCLFDIQYTVYRGLSGYTSYLYVYPIS